MTEKWGEIQGKWDLVRVTRVLLYPYFPTLLLFVFYTPPANGVCGG